MGFWTKKVTIDIPVDPSKLALDQANNEIAFLRDLLIRERKVSERLREELLTVTAAGAKAQLEAYRMQRRLPIRPEAPASPRKDEEPAATVFGQDLADEYDDGHGPLSAQEARDLGFDVPKPEPPPAPEPVPGSEDDDVPPMNDADLEAAVKTREENRLADALRRRGKEAVA